MEKTEVGGKEKIRREKIHLKGTFQIWCHFGNFCRGGGRESNWKFIVLKITYLIIGVAIEGFELQNSKTVLKGKMKSWELEGKINGELDLMSFIYIYIYIYIF